MDADPRVLVARLVASDAVLASRVATARSTWARFRGLMGRAGLDDGEGLWFPGDASIHMFFMRIPIDAVFLAPSDEAATWRVVAIRPGLRPWRDVVWWVRGARGCLELASGVTARAGLSAGDLIRLEPA
jgi:hypothetical protein